MARFWRDGKTVDVWLEPDAEHGGWPRLMTQSGEGAPEPTASERSARREYCERQRQYLREGWRRVPDPARELAIVDEPMRPELEAALEADPDDVPTALVYADWLQQQGHPRGALMAVQHARATAPDDGALAAEEARMLDTHDEVLLGALAAFLPMEGGPHSDPRIELTWERGFIRAARIDGGFDLGESEDLLWELLRHPSARLLRELEIGCHHHGDQDNRTIADVLMCAGPTPPLRRLVLADFDDSRINNIDISRAWLGDLRELGRAYPRLEDVVLKGTGDVDLAGLDLPRARRFALRTSSLRASTLAHLEAARWPALEELELWIGDERYGSDVEVFHVQRLLARPMPELRVLRIMNAPFSDELVPTIATMARTAALEVLDFSLGTLSDDGAAELVALRAAFPALTRLGVFECALTARGLARLRAAGFPVDDRPVSPAWDWREPQQKPRRYVSVAE